MKLLEWARFMRLWQMGPGGCWLWTRSLNRNGYGRFALTGGRRWVVAHRYAYEALVGPIPAGLLLDHRCRVRHCCNPYHTEPVTVRKNTLRGEGPTARAWNGDRSTLYGDEEEPNRTLLWDLGTHANALTEEAR